MSEQSTGKFVVVKNIYFYLVSFVALMMVVFSVADIINLGLKTWVFTKADNYDYPMKPYGCEANFVKPDANFKQPTVEECAKMQAEQEEQARHSRTAQRQRDAVRDISMIVVGAPLFAIHWWMIRKKENI